MKIPSFIENFLMLFSYSYYIQFKPKRQWSDTDPLIPVYHDNGLNPCGGIAFSSYGKFKSSEIMESARVVYPDGSHPVLGTPMMCGCCGKTILGAPYLNLSYHSENTLC